MTVAVTKDSDKITLIPEGLIDTVNSPTFEAEVENALLETKKLVIDFAKVEYISSSGLRVLLKAQKKLSAEDGEMIITNVNDSVKEVFEVTGFSEILTIK